MNSIANLCNWHAVTTEAFMVVCAVLTLLLGAVLPARHGKIAGAFALLGLLAAVAVNVYSASSGASDAMGLACDGGFGVFVIVCALLTGLMAFAYFDDAKMGRLPDFLAVLTVCAAGLSLFARASNLLTAFVALECATLCLYVMAAWASDKSFSLEAGVKYVLAAGVSGAFFAFGAAFVYGASCASGCNMMSFQNFTIGMASPLFVTGLVFIASSVLFKTAAFPFQFWSPDVYQGAPAPVSAFFAVASKAAGVVFLARIFMNIDFAGAGLLVAQDKAVAAVAVVAALTIVVGNLGGITQNNAKRLLAFSGIANAGYLLVAVCAFVKYPALSSNLMPVLYFYLASYLFANYGLFYVMACFKGDDYSLSLADYRGLRGKGALPESTVVLSLASLAGIPPTAGFFGKVLILVLAWYAQLYWLMGVMILGSVVSIYYYFGWIRASFEPAEGSEREFADKPLLKPTMLALSVSTLVFGTAVFFVYFF